MNMPNDSPDAGANVDLALAQFICTLLRAGVEIRLSHLDPDAQKFLGAPHVTAQSQFVQQVLALLRAHCDISFRPCINAMGGVVEGEFVLHRMDVEPRSPQAEFQSFQEGFATAAPFHSKFDLFLPETLLAGMNRWHQVFTRLK